MRNSGAAIFFFSQQYIFHSSVFSCGVLRIIFCGAFFSWRLVTLGGGSSLFNFRSKFPNPILRRLVTFGGGSSFSEFLAKFPNPKFRRLVTFKKFSNFRTQFCGGSSLFTARANFPNPIFRCATGTACATTACTATRHRHMFPLFAEPQKLFFLTSPSTFFLSCAAEPLSVC